ncbi:MAG: tetratricopeptide repeat protein [Bacteroidetes bacterium]|uniref:Tetratricopeptide repeat protein n=1 Tax=Candidatus Gallipaludibacter merdavium TaxID=2840839 RepID=A0A9D9HUE1_9BACT|nr:tetratricopeptide repeat protein [Candidatus Gallipaludibacter merdavium]
MEQNNSYDFEDLSDGLKERAEKFLSDRFSELYFDVDELEILVDHYIAQRRDSDAFALLEYGLKLHPNSSELLVKKAKLLLLQGDIGKASVLLDTLSVDDYEVTMLKMEALVKLNRLSEAVELAENLLKNEEDTEMCSTCLDISSIFIEQDHYDLALSYLKVGKQYCSNNIELLSELAFCLEKVGDVDKAIDVYNDIIDIDPYYADAWFNLAQVFLGQNRYRQALHAYEMCLTIDDSDSLVWLQKGHAHFSLDEFHEAIECYEHCLKDTKDNWQLYLFLAECYDKLGDCDMAIRYNRKVLEAQPSNYDALIALGCCLMEKKQLDEAQDLLSAAVKLRPQASEAWFNMGEVLNFKNQPADAVSYYMRAIELDPKNIDAMIALATTYIDEDKPSEALPVLLRVKAMEPETPRLYLLLAVVYYGLNDSENLLDCLGKMVTSGTEDINIFLNVCPELSEVVKNYIERKK